MRFRFMSVKWNAATRYSAHPFTTKTGARVHFFCLNYPRIRGWYQARVHPFSSGNGKGDIFVHMSDAMIRSNFRLHALTFDPPHVPALTSVFPQ